MAMRPRKTKQTKNEGSMQVSEPKLSNAEKQKRYRERLKFRPGKHCLLAPLARMVM